MLFLLEGGSEVATRNSHCWAAALRATRKYIGGNLSPLISTESRRRRGARIVY